MVSEEKMAWMDLLRRTCKYTLQISYFLFFSPFFDATIATAAVIIIYWCSNKARDCTHLIVYVNWRKSFGMTHTHRSRQNSVGWLISRCVSLHHVHRSCTAEEIKWKKTISHQTAYVQPQTKFHWTKMQFVVFNEFMNIYHQMKCGMENSIGWTWADRLLLYFKCCRCCWWPSYDLYLLKEWTHTCTLHN